ncbi:hypothetical protein ACFQYP_25365 [Nonomuraea antimicrobica]
MEKAPLSGQSPQQQTPSPNQGDDDGFVVSKEVNPDPDAVVDYWTDHRMEDAQPMPMPEVSPGDYAVGSGDVEVRE